VRAERSGTGGGYPSPRAASTPPRGRATDRAERERLERDRHGSAGRAPERHAPRTPPRAGGRHSGEFSRPVPPVQARTGSSVAGTSRTAPEPGSRLRGALAVLGVFLLTLAAAAADSYIGLGLGIITSVALTIGTVVAALVVRRRDLISVVVAPPLVFVAVAVVNIGLAPSATLNAATVATLLVRGFPAMGVATGAAVLISLIRLIARR
jgi:hypothetical protein